MEHRATLEYSEPLLRRAAFAYWRRFIGSAYGVAVFVVALCFAALLRNGDRSWVVGVLGTCLVLPLGFSGAVFVAQWRRSLGRFRRMPSRTASLVATDTQLSSHRRSAPVRFRGRPSRRCGATRNFGSWSYRSDKWSHFLWLACPVMCEPSSPRTCKPQEAGLAPNPSIERTSQRPLRALCAAAHVER